MRRFLKTAAVAAAALSLPVVSFGQAVVLTLANECDIAQVVDNAAEGAELYAVKLTSATDKGTDILWNITTKAGGAALTPGTLLDVSIAPNWRVGIDTDHRTFVYLTYPEGAFPGGARGNWIAVDSDDTQAVGGGYGAVTPHRIGDSLKTAYAGGAGPAGALNLSLPGDATQVSVDTNAGAKMYPAGTNSGVEVVFSPVAEVSDHDILGGGCTVGGHVPIPGIAVGTGEQKGYIGGYNIYRVNGVPGTVPTRAQIFGDANGDGTIAAPEVVNFVGFVPYNGFTMDFAGGEGQGGPAPVIPPSSPSDALADAYGVEQPNDTVARRHTGDELVIFGDTTVDTTGAQGYWYAFQPVIGGALADFGATFGGWGGGSGAGDHQMDLDGDTMMDAISVDDIAGAAGRTPEFISPQAELGIPGLGLTHASLPALSAPVYGIANPAAAFGQVQLTASVAGSAVNLTLSTAVEGQNVSGFNVYRVAGTNRVRVNDSLILARGGEGNVYTLVDGVVASSSRRAGTGAAEYMVEVVYSDGTASKMVGPFSVTSGREGTRRR